MTISVELDRTDSPNGPAVRLRWVIGAAHVPTRATVRHDAVLDPAEACVASDIVCDAVKQGGAAEAELPLVTAHGIVLVRAPRAFWLSLSSALEIVSARIHVGAPTVAQRIDLEPDGRVVRVASSAAGWQTMHEGA